VSLAWRKKRALLCLASITLLLPLLTFAVCWYCFPFPVEKLQQQSCSVVVTDRSGQTLMELAGPDGQRRRPIPLSEMSPWLIKAVVAVEDERFESHCGVDFSAMTRASLQNVWHGRTVSGASTITMQVCKMIDERPRTWQAKIIEAFRAIQLERQATKSQVITAYLNLIPCGGNLRGVEAASQVYFGKSASQLSLGEAALLAGLPQSPNRYAPDRHPEVARRRRATVLQRMLETGQISEAQHDLAINEPLKIGSRFTAAPIATHAAWMAMAQSGNTPNSLSGLPRICTTIDLDSQRTAESLVHAHASSIPDGADVAVVVLDVASGEIRALVGSANASDPVDGQVNGVTARRSPGSTLKPFLYAAAFDAGRLAPDTLVDDVAIERAGWVPENFDRTYRGSVSAAEALRQSLNVPAITITEGLGLPRSLGALQAAGLQLPADAEARGGLAVATGSLEFNLLELTNAYATLAREGIYRPVNLLREDSNPTPSDAPRAFHPNVCRAISSILSTEQRRPRGGESRPDRSMPWFAWKTGTSAGRRDAWAIGHNGRYAIGVWIGFFHGAGHRDFVGRDAAEPLLCQMFESPAFRVTTTSPEWKPWQVERPLPRPVETAGMLVILSPRNDATFLAWNGSTIIHPSTNGTAGATWFHNGRVLADDEARRLSVLRGSHELRAVTPTGQSALVRFVVK
jgi:penicillin-binding protein 1C